MSPLEIELDGRFVAKTGTGMTEITPQDIPMVIYYTGDENGAIVILERPDGERMTHFPLEKPGEAKIIRFKQTVYLPIERGRCGDVEVTRQFHFKRTP